MIIESSESQNGNMITCCAICVTYNPTLSVLKKTISATVSQVDKLYIIDNGSTMQFGAFLADCEKVEAVFLGKNKGIAAALNTGIELARQGGYCYVLLLDQDSIPYPDMIKRYTEVMRAKHEQGTQVAAIGSRYKNSRTQRISGFIRYRWFHNLSLLKKTEISVSTDFLISSGSFYPIEVFNHVGLFNQGLFIDHVDTEWCLRAKKLGFQCIGVWDVLMEHTLGENELHLWLFKWWIQPIHRPFRLYFVMRNSVLMYRMPHVTPRWISSDVVRLLRLTLVYLIFSPQRLDALKWILRGLRDGIYGVTGSARVFH